MGETRRSKTPSVRYNTSEVDGIGDGNGDDGVPGVSDVSSGLTPTQRLLLTHLLTAELVRTRAAALAAGARRAELDEATVRRCRVIEAMTPAGTDTAESDR